MQVSTVGTAAPVLAWRNPPGLVLRWRCGLPILCLSVGNPTVDPGGLGPGGADLSPGGKRPLPASNLPVISTQLCTLCGDCLACCPVDCLWLHQGREIVVVPHACVGCAVCASVCPANAIAMPVQDW